MRLIDADVLKRHIDKLPALPDGNFAGNHSALKALINMQPTIEPSANCSEIPNNSDTISRQQAIDCVTYDVEHTIECLKALPSAQPEPHWIPCSNRLPEEGQKCLVCDKGSIGIDTYIGHGNPYNWKWYTRDYEAWMPLPEPYRGGDT